MISEKTVVIFILKIPGDKDIQLFQREFDAWDPSYIDDQFAIFALPTLLSELENIAELISQDRASLWAVREDGTQEVLLASYDKARSKGRSIFWKGRRSTLELFGIENFSYDN